MENCHIIHVIFCLAKTANIYKPNKSWILVMHHPTAKTVTEQLMLPCYKSNYIESTAVITGKPVFSRWPYGTMPGALCL